MKVIRNGTGWDIAFDMVFTDKSTAATIAQRIAPRLPTLVRDAVDPSMCKRPAAPQSTLLSISAAFSERDAQELPGEGPQTQPSFNVAPSVYSIASRVRAMGMSV